MEVLLRYGKMLKMHFDGHKRMKLGTFHDCGPCLQYLVVWRLKKNCRGWKRVGVGEGKTKLELGNVMYC